MRVKPKHPNVIFFAENMLFVWLASAMLFFIDSPIIGFLWVVVALCLCRLRDAFLKVRAEIKALERVLDDNQKSAVPK